MTNTAKQLTAGAATLASICVGVIIGVAPAQSAEQWTVVGKQHSTWAAANGEESATRARCAERPTGRVLASGTEAAAGQAGGPTYYRAFARCTTA